MDNQTKRDMRKAIGAALDDLAGAFDVSKADRSTMPRQEQDVRNVIEDWLTKAYLVNHN